MSNPTKRKQYDATLPFDDSIPDSASWNADVVSKDLNKFYTVF